MEPPIQRLDAGANAPGDARPRVLVVSALPMLRQSLAALLTEAGYWITVTRTGDEALDELARRGLDALLVDVSGSGDHETLRAVRSQTALPVVALVAPGAVDAAVNAFDLGADDCATWPESTEDSGSVRELDRRLNAVLRRSARNGATEVLVGPSGLTMQPRAHEASVGGVSLDLTPKEFAVLLLLLQRRGDVLTADEISESLWGHETFGARNFVEAHVSRLRHKLRVAGAPNVIVTVRGVGYKLR